MIRLTWTSTERKAAAAADRLLAAGFTRWAREAGTLTAWVRGSRERSALLDLLGPPRSTARERTDRTALAGWRRRLAPGCWLVGAGTAPPPRARAAVVVPVGGGFGLGDHPTTRLAAGLLRANLRTGDRVLDLGTGSGVLAALAGRLGAGAIDAVDVDADALVHARATLRANRVRARVWRSDLLARVPADGRYRLVAANLYGDLVAPLLADGRLAQVLAADGILLLSGVSDDRVAAVRAALAAGGWRLRARRREDGWWGLVAARPRRGRSAPVPPRT